MTKLDDMLSKWPMRESTQLEADEAGERVVAAIQAGQLPASIDESILAAPLPKTPEEEQTSPAQSGRPGRASSGIGVESKMSKDRTRERTSFQELAKMATTPPPPTSSSTGSGPNRSSSIPSSVLPTPASSSGKTGVVRGDEASSTDSGIVDLKAIASADPSGSQRAQSTPLASSGLFDDESAPPKPAIAPAVAEKLASTPPPSSAAAAVAQTATAAVAKKPEEKKSGGGGAVIAIGALFAAGAIAAGVVMFVKFQHNKAAMAALAANAPTTVVAANDKPKAQATSATPAGSLAQTDTTQELPDTVETVQNGTGKPTFRFHAKSGGAGGTTTTTTPDPATAGTVDPKLIANVPTGPAGGGNGDLAEAMKTAAGGGTGLGGGGGSSTPQGNSNGSVPQRPSQGQVAGAVGSVMPGAKSCLGADEPMSRATITFQSDGTVKSVSVSGFAAGKPQEACIKTALSKATVTPFAEATYPVPVTIRSN